MPTLTAAILDRPWDFARDLLHRALTHFVGTGTLRVTFADGRRETYGNGTGPSCHIALLDRQAEIGLLTNPGLALGERYMDGTLQIRSGDLHDLLTIMIGNRNQGRLPGALRALMTAADHLRPTHLNDTVRARRNVAHHYDLDGRLYDLFLDDQRQYSCAYFSAPDISLEQAQAAKMARIAHKLHASPGQSALDIGCGWGGMAVHLAQEHGLNVTGITLSEEQLAGARVRAAAAGVADQVRIDLQDYRHVPGVFDRIVSIGMAEHVGRAALGTYFGRIAELLAPGGVALVHFISRYDGPRKTNPWLEKYIFPGGYTPPLSQALAAVEQSGLMVADVEVWRTHYAHTLRHWRARFLANHDRAVELYDERFCRMWDFYLAGCQASFEVGENVVAQLLLIRDRDALPETRSWMDADPTSPRKLLQ